MDFEEESCCRCVSLPLSLSFPISCRSPKSYAEVLRPLSSRSSGDRLMRAVLPLSYCAENHLICLFPSLHPLEHPDSHNMSVDKEAVDAHLEDPRLCQRNSSRWIIIPIPLFDPQTHPLTRPVCSTTRVFPLCPYSYVFTITVIDSVLTRFIFNFDMV